MPYNLEIDLKWEGPQVKELINDSHEEWIDELAHRVRDRAQSVITAVDTGATRDSGEVHAIGRARYVAFSFPANFVELGVPAYGNYPRQPFIWPAYEMEREKWLNGLKVPGG